jgi:hypothetical protein
MLVLKILFIFMAIMFTTSLIVKVIARNGISVIHFMLVAVAWTGIITLFLLI